MNFIGIHGKNVKVFKTNKYKINWDAKSLSKVQFSAKRILYKYWLVDFVYEEFPVAGTRLKFDFFNASKSIVIEIDGNQHFEYNKFFHKGSKSNFINQIKRDEQKEKFCELNKIILHRIRADLDIEDQISQLNLK